MTELLPSPPEHELGRRTPHIHDRYCQGLIVSSNLQRRTVEAETDPTRPAETACAANSAELHRDNGTSRCAGGSHAIALTSATTSGSNNRAETRMCLRAASRTVGAVPFACH
jgi:hypothetical protein